jgi:predicted acyl esterase
MRGSLEYATGALVENTEVAGPIMLKLYAATTDTDIHWIISLLEIDPAGKQRILTKGWLKGSHRQLDMDSSRPWEPIYTHKTPEPLEPMRIYEFNIKLVPTGILFKAGSRIGIKISCADDDPKSALELIGGGSLRRSAVSRITVFHNEEYPSYLLLPVTKGNVVNTYFSGGTP